ncbi:MAG: hypothetical protein NTV75_11475 [Bacteroidia bacterium]|nr:hypothetical protein [Bacteroidia bacterium]
MFKVIYANELYNDIQNAVDFYNSRAKGLGVRFFKTVKIQTSEIQSNAFGFQVRYADVRCIPLYKFPYTIHYRVIADTNTIMIIAIFCDFQNPETWADRLK